jgi:pyrimidine-nucleoside phosphorylase
MPTAAKSRELADTLVALGRKLGLQIVACLTDMNQPLGRNIGNALEVRESIEALQGGGPEDHLGLVIELTAHMLLLGKKAKDLPEARKILRGKIDSGEAFEKFLKMVEAQGGDPRKVETPESLPIAKKILEACADRSGYVTAIDTREVGLAGCGMGVGRLKLTDKIDPGIGFMMLRKIGDKVRTGDPIWAIHARKKSQAGTAAKRLMAATSIGSKRAFPPRLIKGVRG